MAENSVFEAPVIVVGAGVSGLMTAYTLLEDGFQNVTIVTRDKSVGGTWARERVYPGLRINNVHGEYRFSVLDMPPPKAGKDANLQLTGEDICDYMEEFANRFLLGPGRASIRFQTEVLNIERASEWNWEVHVKDLRSGAQEILRGGRLVLATGGCSQPWVPESLSATAGASAGFSGIIMHSSEFPPRMTELLAAVKPCAYEQHSQDLHKGAKSENNDSDDETVVVIGGGKSAQDAARHLTLQGRKVVMVFNTTDVFLAAKTPLPDFIRKSRFLTVMYGYRELNSRLERFLHTTKVGGMLVRFIFNAIQEDSFSAFGIDSKSPLRRCTNLFWGVRLSDEGVATPDNFHSLAVAGKIKLVSPVHAVGFDGNNVALSDGRRIKAKAVVVCTGYQSSWSNIIKPKMAEELGIAKHLPKKDVQRTWDYPSLKDGKQPQQAIKGEEENKTVTTLLRGIVPAANILRRDFAIAGALFTANPGYTSEVVSHWISGYFQGDKMRISTTVDEAMSIAEEQAAWMRRRFPGMVKWANESYSGTLDFFTYPQAADELLEDMYLPGMRTGNSWFNWFTWFLRPIDITQLRTLGEERRALRSGRHQTIFK